VHTRRQLSVLQLYGSIQLVFSWLCFIQRGLRSTSCCMCSERLTLGRAGLELCSCLIFTLPDPVLHGTWTATAGRSWLPTAHSSTSLARDTTQAPCTLCCMAPLGATANTHQVANTHFFKHCGTWLRPMHVVHQKVMHHTTVAEGLLHCCFGRHTPLGRAHLCWVPDCVSILFQLLVLLSVLTHMMTLFSDLNVTGAAIIAAAAAVILTLTVGLRLICTCRHDTGCTRMLVLTRLCHPRAFPPPKKSLRPTNKPGNQTNSNTPNHNRISSSTGQSASCGLNDRA
jgi:hypothetical protein